MNLKGGVSILKCNHECSDCGETWVCSVNYYSNYHSLTTEVNHGYYCNSYCPSCKEEERSTLDALFNKTDQYGYTRSVSKQIVR